MGNERSKRIWPQSARARVRGGLEIDKRSSRSVWQDTGAMSYSKLPSGPWIFCYMYICIVYLIV